MTTTTTNNTHVELEVTVVLKGPVAMAFRRLAQLKQVTHEQLGDVAILAMLHGSNMLVTEEPVNGDDTTTVVAAGISIDQVVGLARAAAPEQPHGSQFQLSHLVEATIWEQLTPTERKQAGKLFKEWVLNSGQVDVGHVDVLSDRHNLYERI